MIELNLLSLNLDLWKYWPTETRKNMNLPYSIRMYWTNFWQPTAYVQQNIFEETIIEGCNPYLYASFGTFCVQIGQLFASQWVLKQSEEFRKWRHFPSMIADFQTYVVQRLTVPRIIDQFGRKRCQKKRKYVDHKLLNEFFQKKIFYHTWTIGC